MKFGLKHHDLVQGLPVREEEILVQASPLVEAVLVEKIEYQYKVRQKVVRVGVSSRVLLTQPESRGLVCDVRQNILKFGKCV